MKGQKHLTAILFIGLIVTSQPAFAEEKLFTGEETILKGLRLTYRLHLDEAAEVFARLKELHPESPAGTFYSGAVKWGMAESDLRWRWLARLYTSSKPPRRKGQNSREVLEAMKETIKQCKAILKDDPDNFEALFYMGGAYGFKARVKIFDRHYFSGMLAGRRSAIIFDQLLESYPERGDSMLGPGIYRYYVGRLSAPMRWVVSLLGLKGTKEEGLLLMEQAHERASLSSIESAEFLARIYRMHERDTEKTLQWADVLEREIPDAPLAYYHRIIINNRIGDSAGEEEATRKLSSMLDESVPQEIRDRWKPLLSFHLGMIYKNRGMAQKAKLYLEEALTTENLDKWLKREIEKKMKTTIPFVATENL